MKSSINIPVAVTSVFLSFVVFSATAADQRRDRARPIAVKPINEATVTTAALPQWYFGGVSNSYGVAWVAEALTKPAQDYDNVTTIIPSLNRRPPPRGRKDATSALGTISAEISEKWVLDPNQSRGAATNAPPTIFVHEEFDLDKGLIHFVAHAEIATKMKKLGSTALNPEFKDGGLGSLRNIENAYSFDVTDEPGILRRRVTYRIRKDQHFAIRYSHQKSDKSWHEDSRLVYRNTGEDKSPTSFDKTPAKPFAAFDSSNQELKDTTAWNDSTANSNENISIDAFINVIAFHDTIELQ